MTGAAAPTQLFDPGSVVRWGLPVATAVMNLAATVSIGAFFLCAFVLPRPPDSAPATTGGAASAQGAPRTRVEQTAGAWQFTVRVGAVAAVLWAPAQMAHLLLTHLAALGVNIGSPSYGAQLVQFVTEIDMGRILIWGVLLTAVLAVVAVAVTGYASAAVATALAAIAVVPIALTGHAAGAANHELAVTAIWLHVIGVAVWAGGLAVLCMVAHRTGPALGDAVGRYSQVALWCFALVAVSGTASAWIRMESVGDLFTSAYGRLLLLKVVLTVVVGAAGWWHRRATIPAIGALVPPPTRVDEETRQSRSAVGWAFWRLAGVEVLIMGTVMGVAVALGSSAPPVPQEPVTDASIVFSLTGSPVPPPPTVLTYLTSWRLDPLLGLLGVAAILVYLRWVVRLHRRGHNWTRRRTVSWVVGWVLVLWLTNGGPAAYGSVLFSAYVAQVVAVATIVPILLVYGAPGALALQGLPRRRDGSRGPREWLLGLARSPLANMVSHPALMAVILAGSLALVFYTPLVGLTANSFFARAALVVYLLLIGGGFVTAVLKANQRSRSNRLPLLTLVVALACYIALGISITSQTVLLAPNYFGQMELPWAPDILADQNLGGSLTMGVSGTSVLALAIVVAIKRSPRQERLGVHPTV